MSGVESDPMKFTCRHPVNLRYGLFTLAFRVPSILFRSLRSRVLRFRVFRLSVLRYGHIGGRQWPP